MHLTIWVGVGVGGGDGGGERAMCERGRKLGGESGERWDGGTGGSGASLGRGRVGRGGNKKVLRRREGGTQMD